MRLFFLAAQRHRVRPSTDCTTMKRGIVSFGKKTTLLLGCAVLFVFTTGLALSMVFPIGGGQFHAIFAYSDEGRLQPALVTYIVEVGALALTALSLLVLHYPLRWWVVASVASCVGISEWWLVCSWEPQSIDFNKVVMLLLPIIPTVIFFVCAVVTWYQRAIVFRDSHTE